jgi:hypothetical protein
MEDEEARRVVEAVLQRIDLSTDVMLLEPGRHPIAGTVRMVLMYHGQHLPFNATLDECTKAETPVGRERLARRLGAALGLQSPDQMTGPPTD